MKTLTLLLAGLACSAAASAADPARLGLWITDRIGNTSGNECDLSASPASASNLPAIPPTLTEYDITVWNADKARWTVNPDEFSVGGAAKLQDRCFVLAIDGKLVTSGVVLSSHSARMTGFPTISVYARNDALDLQLTSSNHGKHMRLIHVDRLDAVLGQRANMERQMQRMEANRQLGIQQFQREWKSAVAQLIEAGKIRKDMPVAEVSRHLGPPSKVEGPEAKRIYRWYFNTPMHVNPLFIVRTEGEIVQTYTLTSG